MSKCPLEVELKNLLGAVSRGDEAALATFYDLTCAKVFGLVRFMLKDDGVAEEVVLDTFWQVWREAGRYGEEKAGPLAWLLMMARSRAIDRLRSMKKTSLLCDIDGLEDDLADPGEGPEAAVIADERGHQVRACLARLPLVERQKLALAFFKGLSQSEIAAYCDMPLGTVKTHIRNGMARLGELLEGQAGLSLDERP